MSPLLTFKPHCQSPSPDGEQPSGRASLPRPVLGDSPVRSEPYTGVLYLLPCAIPGDKMLDDPWIIARSLSGPPSANDHDPFP